MRSIRTLVATALVGLLLAACGGLDEASGGDALEPDALEGRAFLSTTILEDGAERPLVPGTRIQLGFSDGRISINAGCNSMGGGFEIDGDTLRLIGGLATTEMGCDPERHEQDAWVSAFLGDAPRVRLEGSRLTLSGGSVVMELLDREVADPDRPLAGTRWRLDSLVEGDAVSSVPAGLTATLEIGQDGSVRLDAGCNEWFGSVSADEQTLTFDIAATTEARCDPEATALERDVLAVLTHPEIEYAIDGPLLSLRADDLGLDWRA